MTIQGKAIEQYFAVALFFSHLVEMLLWNSCDTPNRFEQTMVPSRGQGGPKKNKQTRNLRKFHPNLALVLQPRFQALLGLQNGGSEKTLANIRSRVSKNIGDFDCFKMAAGFMIG